MPPKIRSLHLIRSIDYLYCLSRRSGNPWMNVCKLANNCTVLHLNGILFDAWSFVDQEFSLFTALSCIAIILEK